MASIDDQLTELYVFVDDFLKTHPTLAQWRRSNYQSPAFSDAEVLTIALLQGCLGVATLKKTYQLIANNWRAAFPRLCSYAQWLNRLHALTGLVGHLLQAALPALKNAFYLLDAKPVPLCQAIRHGRVRLLREDGAWFGKSSIGWFFGFKLHTLVHGSGLILGAVLTPANWHDSQVALALAWLVEGGLALADLGYRSEPLRDLLLEQAELLLLTPADAGADTGYRALLSSVRERVETTFSSLWQRFIDRVYSRSWNGLWNTLKLKMVHYNLTRAGILSA